MSYPEKLIARQFYSDLSKAFGQTNHFFLRLFQRKEKDITITVAGEGVHWNCKIEKGKKKCVVACFHYAFVHKQGAEYYIEFTDDNNMLATGRTMDKELALSATKDWISGKTVPELYTEYKFIDELKRKMEYINTYLLHADPALKNCKPALKQPWGDSINYSLVNKDRAIEYHIDGYSNLPKHGFGFNFLWDECPVFYAYNEHLEAFMPLVSDWLLNDKKPSELNKACPWIELYPVAVHYENGDGIAGEFTESWDNVEKFYSEYDFPLKHKALVFIQSIRGKGFDKTLRAGTSLYSLIISKSRRYGLRENQRCIMFSFGEQVLYVHHGTEKRIAFKEVTLTDEILKMLESLNAEEIS